jgi:transposase InsO family protein
MPNEEKMTINERRKYLRLIKKRYLKASKAGRGRLLDEMEVITGLHRKSLIRLMSGSLDRKHRRKKRGRTYGPEVDDALRVISDSFDHICAERLQPNLVWMATHLARHGELKVSQLLLDQLSQISVSTVRRILNRLRQDERRLPRKGPTQANRVAREIPMKRIPWNEEQPGHFEVDAVHHCGHSSSGHYVHTIQMVDVATGWTEQVATLGRSYRVMEDAFRRILARLPFQVLEIHSDNGSEFLNAHLVRFWKEMVKGVTLSRSRPFHKNDNRFVEQKNSTLVRAYLGLARFDTAAQTNAINQLYEKMWLYYNFFQPVMRLTEKTAYPLLSAQGQPSRIKRRFDQARTPFDRLCETDAMFEEHKEQLGTLRDQTNPRHLRQEIYQLIDQIFLLPAAVPGETEDVYQTLFAPTKSQKGEDILVTLLFDRMASVR